MKNVNAILVAIGIVRTVQCENTSVILRMMSKLVKYHRYFESIYKFLKSDFP